MTFLSECGAGISHKQYFIEAIRQNHQISVFLYTEAFFTHQVGS